MSSNVSLRNVNASRRCKQCNRMLALALEPNVMVNSTSMSWQHICLPLKSYIIDVDDQAVA
jgi:hypothetical protein